MTPPFSAVSKSCDPPSVSTPPPPANFWQVPYPEIWHISYIFLGIESEMENMRAD